MRTVKGIAVKEADVSGWNMAVKATPLILFMTVCVTDPSLYRGVVTAKYFYFTAVICLVLPVSVYRAFRQKKSPFLIRAADVAVSLFVFYLILHRITWGGNKDMAWWLFLLMIPLYLSVRTFSENKNGLRLLTVSILIAVLVQTSWGILQLCGLLPSYHNAFRVTGSLFNPAPYAGFVAVCVPLALGIFFSRDTCRWERALGCVVLLSSLVILPFTGSRAAWLAALAGGLAVILCRGASGRRVPRVQLFSRKSTRMVFVFSGIILAMALLYGMYHLKKDSADGRWFIWNVSASIVRAHPVFGVGTGRFAAAYGQAQADYFLSGKGTGAQIMIADHPDYAFSEYMHIAVESGLAGLFLFLLAVGLCLSPFLQGKTGNRRTLALYYFPALTGMLVFSLFSYPFDVLPLAMLFVTFLAVAASRTAPLHRQPGFRWHMAGGLALLVLTTAVALQVLPRGQSYRQWREAHLLFRSGAYADALDEFILLYTRLDYEKNFLMEYGRCLSHLKEYEESNRVFGECLGVACDPEAYNYMGNNHKALGQHVDAEQAYIRAASITPNRHYPEYLLMRLYHDTGREREALDKARHLIEKPVKINSQIIRRIRQEASNILEANENKNINE